MYTIGQVEKITGVKPHILRYWEEMLPCFTPHKNLSGRRMYSNKDVEIIFRLKYLIYKKQYTIEGARRQIVQDAASLATERADAIFSIREMRSRLVELLVFEKDYGKDKT